MAAGAGERVRTARPISPQGLAPGTFLDMRSMSAPLCLMTSGAGAFLSATGRWATRPCQTLRRTRLLAQTAGPRSRSGTWRRRSTARTRCGTCVIGSWTLPRQKGDLPIKYELGLSSSLQLQAVHTQTRMALASTALRGAQSGVARQSLVPGQGSTAFRGAHSAGPHGFLSGQGSPAFGGPLHYNFESVDEEEEVEEDDVFDESTDRFEHPPFLPRRLCNHYTTASGCEKSQGTPGEDNQFNPLLHCADNFRVALVLLRFLGEQELLSISQTRHFALFVSPIERTFVKQ